MCIVIALAAKMVILVALNDLLAYASHGPLAALRAAGRMGFAAFATFVPLNLIALPLAGYLMFGGGQHTAAASGEMLTTMSAALGLATSTPVPFFREHSNKSHIIHRKRPHLLTASHAVDGLTSYWMAIDIGVALQLLMLIAYTSRMDWRALILHERRGSHPNSEDLSASETIDDLRP